MDTDEHESEKARRMGTNRTYPPFNRVSVCWNCCGGRHRGEVQEGSRGLRSAERDDTPGTETKTERTPEGCKNFTSLRADDSGTPSGCGSTGAADRGASLRCDPRLPSGNPPGCSSVCKNVRSQRGWANCHPPLNIPGRMLTLYLPRSGQPERSTR